jgi:hypothetical protein
MTLFESIFGRIDELGRGFGSALWVRRLRAFALKSTPRLLATVLVVAATAGRANAEGGPTRPCVGGDLDGIFVLVAFHEIPARGYLSAVEMAPYRFLAFFPPSTWSEAAFNVMPKNADLMTLLNAQRKDHDFTWRSDGRLAFNRRGAVQFLWSCAVSLRTGDGFQENDLLLVGNQTGGQSELHQLFRRWTGGPVARTDSKFDPAPSAASPRPAADLVDIQPSLPDKPAPFRIKIVNGNGPGGPGTQVSVVVTNEGHAPLSAFMLVFRGAQTAQRWKESDVYACVEHPPAWQPGQQWAKVIGHPLQVGRIEISPGAAVFADGSTWGDPHRLAQLKSRRGNCEWPGS